MWAAHLERLAQEREARGLTRSVRPLADAAIDLAGNDYLGLRLHPAVLAGACAAVEEYGAGAGASRLVTGTLGVHTDLEAALAGFAGAAAALAFSTGYHANLGVLTALGDDDAVIVSDAHNHASLIDGARLSRAEVRVVPHLSVAGVRAALDPNRRCLVVTESIFSVNGDSAPLADLGQVTAEAGALLVVDEAHGLGVAGPEGRGGVHEAGLAGAGHVVVTATLSKSLGSQGGAVLAAPEVLEHLVNTARPFIYDTGLAPAAAGAARAALALIDAERVRRLHDRIRGLADRLDVPRPAGGVLSVFMAGPQEALDAQGKILAEGVRVGCFRPPSTPDGSSRLRITANAGLTDSDWDRAADVVVRQVADHR